MFDQNSTHDDADWVGKSRSRLALRRAEKPATKAGQIRALWPDIEAALAVGQTMKTISGWLREDAGIAVGGASLSSYISRIRRRVKMNRLCDPAIELPAPSQRGSRPPSSHARRRFVPESSFVQVPDDPLAQAMRALSRPRFDIRKIHNDGDPEGRNLI